MVSGFSAASVFSRAAISSSASSQVMGRNSPLPFRPTRFIGVRSRSGEYVRSRQYETLVHSVPSVKGISGSPWIFFATPSSTVTSMAQVSGQSCGQATLTMSGETTSLMRSFYVQQLDPVLHRRRARALQMAQAADVGGGDDLRRTGVERRELAAAQLAGDLGVQERVRAGGAAAKVRVVYRRELIAGGPQQRLDLAADLLAVLQRAGRLECHLAACAAAGDHLWCQHLAKVTRQRRNTRRFFAVALVPGEVMPVFLHRHAAAARGHHDRLDFAACHTRPPGVDQGAHVVATLLLVVQMEAQRAATARAGCLDERDAGAVELARSGGVDRRRERALDAAGER